MTNYICTTCGTQFAETKREPEHCPICEDERQYVNPAGQQWTTLDRLKRKHKIVIQRKERNLYGIGMTPAFGIGQRALLIKTPEGNMLWDCISLVDEAAVDIINAFGGIQAIAISQPHYYSSMIEWSLAFNDVPVYLHQNDRPWIQRPHKNINFWNGESLELFAGITLHNVGGHFEGGTILHWPASADGQGALLTGDILQVMSDRKHISFMYSYPNYIPLNADAVNQITRLLKPLPYDRVYGAWWDKNISDGGKKAVKKSAQRYIQAIS